MLAMLIILVTLLLAVVTLILTAPTRLVPVAAIRAGLDRADMGAWDAGYKIKQAQAEERAQVEADLYAARLASIRESMDRAAKATEERLQAEAKAEYALKLSAYESALKALESAVLAGERPFAIRLMAESLFASACEMGFDKVDAVKAVIRAGRLDSLALGREVPEMLSLDSSYAVVINDGVNGTVVYDRGEATPVKGEWVHVMRPVAVGASVEAVDTTISIRGEICVTPADGPLFDAELTGGMAQDCVAIVFEGAVSHLFDMDAGSAVDARGLRYVWRLCSTIAPHKEGWLVPANAKVLGLVAGRDVAQSEIASLRQAGYVVVESLDSASAVKEILALRQ